MLILINKNKLKYDVKGAQDSNVLHSGFQFNQIQFKLSINFELKLNVKVAEDPNILHCGFKFNVMLKVLKIPMYFTVAWEENRLMVDPEHR